MKKQNKRTSIITRKKYNVDQLIRFTFNDNILSLCAKNIKGRGYYIEKDFDLINNKQTFFILSKRFNNASNFDEFMEKLKNKVISNK